MAHSQLAVLQPAVLKPSTRRRDRDGLHLRPKKPGGTWYFYFRAEDGRLHEKSTRTPSFAEAKQVRHDFLEHAKRNALPSDRAAWTVNRAADVWLHKRTLEGLAPNTLRFDTERLRPVRRVLGELKLRDLTAQVLLNYKDQRMRKVSAKTFNGERLIIRTLLREARLWSLVEIDFTPARQSKKSCGRALEPEEETRLRAKASTPGREMVLRLFELGRNTGLRGGELRGLRLRDLDLEAGTVYVRRAVTKTDAGERSVPLNDEAKAAAAWLRARAIALGASRPDHFLFPADMSKRGGKGFDSTQPQRSFRTAWRRVTREANLRGFRQHDLRHTFRSDLADRDVPTDVAMDLMGHRSPEMSAHYAHMRREAQTRREEQKRNAVLLVGNRAASG